jgi:hypothetical protein
VDYLARVVSTRYRVAKALPLVIELGEFRVNILPKYAEFEPVLREGFTKAEADYARAGFPIHGPVKVEVKGKAFGGTRSFYTTGGNFIQLVPEALRNHGDYHVFVHELAHWYHQNQISGGFNNRDIVRKYTEVRGTKDTGGSNFERLQDEIKLKEKELNTLRKKIPAGTIAEVEDWDDPFRHNAKYIRKYKVIKPADREGHMTWCELLNPSPWDLRVSPETLKKVLTQDLVENIPGIGQQIKELKKEVSGLYDKSNDLATGKATDTRYQELRSMWVPTDYAKGNHLEWFAELMTTLILSPASLADEVKDWLKSVA